MSFRRPGPVQAESARSSAGERRGHRRAGPGEERAPLAGKVLEAAVRMLKVQLPALSKAAPSPRERYRDRSAQFQNGFGYCLSSVYLHYLAVRPFLPKQKQQQDNLINLKIQKEKSQSGE